MPPVEYKPSKHAYFTEGDSMTETEHTASCDPNLMMRNISRGMDVRTATHGQWDNEGYDDMNMDGLTFRIKKQELEESLQQAPKELPEEILKFIPKKIREKFGWTSEPKKPLENKTPQNDDKTTIKGDPIPNPTLAPKNQPQPE